MGHPSVPNPLRSQPAASREQWGVGGGGGSIWGAAVVVAGGHPCTRVIWPGHAHQPGECICTRSRAGGVGRPGGSGAGTRSHGSGGRGSWNGVRGAPPGQLTLGDCFALSALVSFPRLPGCCVRQHSPISKLPAASV